MSEIAIFAFESAAVRTLTINDAPWFVAVDIAQVLGYRDAPNMVRMLDDDERGTHNVSTLGGLLADTRLSLVKGESHV